MNHKKSEVFQQTYHSYLAQINEIDFLAKADILGLEKEGNKLLVPFYNKTYSFSKNGIELQNGKTISAALQVMICKYILTCPLDPQPHDNRLQPYREFKNAAPLISHFATTTTLALEKAFAGKVGELKLRCEDAQGVMQESSVYDLSFLFYAFPRIPVVLNFNDEDDMFPAACSVLYSSSAENFLDMECLCMTGTSLASILIS